MKPYSTIDARHPVAIQSIVSSFVSRATTAWNRPWLMRNEIRRLIALPALRLRFAFYGLTWGPRWRIFGMPIIQRARGSRIELGAGLVLRSWQRTNPLLPNHPVVLSTRTAEARIRIGEDCGLTGTTIAATQCIEIGNRVLIGANSTIVDSDFHPLTPEGRHADMSNGSHRPVFIQDDVFIGMNCLILKGVTIGAGSVVGAGSIVSRDVPPRTLVAGNPAQVVRTF